MRVAYSVESGDYSDFVIHALFETQELAETYRAVLVDKEARYWSEGIGTYEEEKAAAAEKYDVVRYQLWDALPIVEGEEYRRDDTGAEVVA